MRNLPIRWQLAAFYTALLTVILLALGLLLYANVDGFLQDNTASGISNIATNVINQEIAVTGKEDDGKAPPGQKPSPYPTPNLQQIVAALRNQLPQRDARIVAYDANGAAVIISDGSISSTQGAENSKTVAAPGLAWPPLDIGIISATLQQADNLPRRVVQSLSDGSGRAMILYLPLHQPGSKLAVGAVAISVSMAQSDAVLLWLRWAIPLGIFAALLVSFLLGVPLARALLRPLDRVVGAANRIASGDLAARAALPPVSNEIGQLAHAFDSMADRVQTGFVSQRQFVADASHELKTPLTALSGEVEMMLTGADGGEPAARSRLLTSMEGELGRMSRLVADLLTLSRLDSEAGGSLAAPLSELVDLTALCREVAEQTSHLAPQHRIVCDIPQQLLTVRGNPDRLRQVLLNLADNARKFTAAGGSISFTLRQEGERAVVSIRDSGVGIAPADLPHIFDRFYRSEKSRTRRAGGSGLGLAIAHAIATTHGGSLSVNSTPNVGSDFRLILPIATLNKS
jgi:two-component system, OmpR family, sensor kinase